MKLLLDAVALIKLNRAGVLSPGYWGGWRDNVIMRDDVGRPSPAMRGIRQEDPAVDVQPIGGVDLHGDAARRNLKLLQDHHPPCSPAGDRGHAEYGFRPEAGQTRARIGPSL